MPFDLRIWSKSNCDRVQFLLSDYLSGGLSTQQNDKVSSHLAVCRVCQIELEELTETVRLVRALPRLPVPRSFVITTPQPETSGLLVGLTALTSRYGALRNATAAVAIAFAVVLTANVALYSVPGTVVSLRGITQSSETVAILPQPAQPAMVSQEDRLVTPLAPELIIQEEELTTTSAYDAALVEAVPSDEPGTSPTEPVFQATHVETATAAEEEIELVALAAPPAALAEETESPVTENARAVVPAPSASIDEDRLDVLKATDEPIVAAAEEVREDYRAVMAVDQADEPSVAVIDRSVPALEATASDRAPEVTATVYRASIDTTVPTDQELLIDLGEPSPITAASGVTRVMQAAEMALAVIVLGLGFATGLAWIGRRRQRTEGLDR